MDKKTVWILGAGASKSATDEVFPLLREIPRVAADAGILEDWQERAGFRALQSYLLRRFGEQLAPSAQLDLESALTTLDIDVAVDNDPELHLARVTLVGLLHETFSRLHAIEVSGNGEYQHMVNLLAPEDSIITFNWDVLCDNALGRRSSFRDGHVYLLDNQYGQFLKTLTGHGEGIMRNLGPQSPIRTWKGRAGILLKAHGSIDWYQCRNAMCANLGRLFPIPERPEQTLCALCLEKSEPVIVPPTLNKRLREVPAIRRLWNVAGREVERATDIIIWGYSLPPTDFFSDWLLRQTRPDAIGTVTLINPSVVTSGRQTRLGRDFISRFLQALRFKKGHTALKLFERYADFRERNDIRAKYPQLGSSIKRFAGAV